MKSNPSFFWQKIKSVLKLWYVAYCAYALPCIKCGVLNQILYFVISSLNFSFKTEAIRHSASILSFRIFFLYFKNYKKSRSGCLDGCWHVTNAVFNKHQTCHRYGRTISSPDCHPTDNCFIVAVTAAAAAAAASINNSHFVKAKEFSKCFIIWLSNAGSRGLSAISHKRQVYCAKTWTVFGWRNTFITCFFSNWQRFQRANGTCHGFAG